MHRSNIVRIIKGEEKKFNFVLGYVELPNDQKWEAPGIINKKPAKALLKELTTDAQIADRFQQLRNIPATAQLLLVTASQSCQDEQCQYASYMFLHPAFLLPVISC
jgi:hypothetical protein